MEPRKKPTRKFSSLFSGESTKDVTCIRKKIVLLEKDINLIVQYLAEKGIEIPDKILKEISEITSAVSKIECKENGKSTDVNSDASKIEQTKFDELYLKALNSYNKLSKLASPASAVTIKYTKQSYGLFFANNKVINLIICLTILSLISFILTSTFNWPKTLSVIFASSLGAGFYTLSTSRKYLVNRTFNPIYNQTYLIRYLLGIISGTILAFILKDIISDEKFKFTQEILAVVGGYSADAVSTILERIADVIVSIFKGTSKKEIEEVENKVQKEKEVEKQKSKIESLNALAELKAQASNTKDVDKIINEIDKRISDLQ